MSIDREPDPSVEEPRFRIPFSDADRDLLEERVPHLLNLLDETVSVQGALEGHRLLGSRETLSGIRALEMIGRFVEAMSIELLAHYRRTGDSTAHGYRSTEQLLVGEFRITSGEARRRKILSETLVSRISDVGEELTPLRPAVAAEYADGRISAGEAKALCDAIDDLPPMIRAKYAGQVEKTLVELAPTVSLADVPKLSQRIIQHIDPDGKLPRSEPDPHKYNVSLTQQRNGDWRLRGLLDCPTGTTLRALLYGRMKAADVPVAVRPHRECNTDGSSAAPARESTGGDQGRPTSSQGREPEACRRDPSTPPADGGSAARSPSNRSAPPVSGCHEQSPVVDDADDYSVSSAPVRDRAPDRSGTNGSEGSDCEQSGGEGLEGAIREEIIPQVPLEAMWQDTHVTLYADATIEVSGRKGTFVEDEPRFYLNPSGWPIHLSERVSEVAQKLLADARESETGVATAVVWEKILGRAPVHGTSTGEPLDSTLSGERSASTRTGVQSAPSRTGEQSASSRTEGQSASLQPGMASSGHVAPGGGPPVEGTVLDPRPVSAATPEGVFADGSQNGRRISETVGADAPGLARHDRFGFLLRSVARERVLHGADHALVVTATVDELAKPHSILNTHAGASTTLGGVEQWSNAAQMFVHIKDGGGRSVGIRSQGRFATRTQMAVLAARDQGCTFPDCDAPAEWCEAHHIVAYSRGGQTTVDNLTLVCPFHHRWFERSGWESVFKRGFPAWKPPKSFDPRRRIMFHSRFRIALMGLPPELPLGA